MVEFISFVNKHHIQSQAKSFMSFFSSSVLFSFSLGLRPSPVLLLLLRSSLYSCSIFRTHLCARVCVSEWVCAHLSVRVGVRF